MDYAVPHTSNGFNGIACGKRFIYTYNGNSLIQYNKTTGEIIDSISIDQTPFSHSGIDTDYCENVYIGTGDSIMVYDENLTHLGNILAPNAIYDLLIHQDKIYLTGNGFVAQIETFSELDEGVITMDSLAAICGECSGQATVTVNSNPCSGLEYVGVTWSPGGETTETISNLCPGVYVVTANWVTESGDTITATDSVEIVNAGTDLNLELISYKHPTCFGFNDGSIIVGVADGLGEVTYEWEPENESGGPIFDTLSPGEYKVIAHSGEGCIDSLLITLINPDSLRFSEFGYHPALCRRYPYQNGDGIVFAAATGGIPDYTYEWLNIETGEVSANSTWGGLNAGTYQITVTDENGCELVEFIHLDSINPNAQFSITSDQLDVNYEGTELVIADFINQSTGYTNGVDTAANWIFLWNLDHPNDPWIPSTDYNEIMSKSYMGEVVYEVCLIARNKLGCADTSCKNIIVHVKPEFVAPNVFSPNGDGINDTFTFEFKSLGIETFECTIVNRWGVKVAELTGITDSWNGNAFNGAACTNGVYYYEYKAVSTNNTVFQGHGNVQLVREK